LKFHINAHLSNNFRRTCFFPNAEQFEAFAIEGVYDGYGFKLRLEAADHLAAAELVFAILNSYPEELHCPAEYAPIVAEYRKQKNRSLSVGDLLVIHRLETWSPSVTKDGRYGVASSGFIHF
jgi:hypothetical protein